MKKSIFLFFAAILCATSAWAANAELKNGQFLYCTVNNSNWKSWSITFNWYWNEGDWCCQDNGTKLATDIWYAKIPNDYTRAVQLIRCKTDFSEQWDWSKTVKASSRANNNQNCVNITGSNWGDAAVSWTTYAPPMSSVTLSNNGTVVNSGSGTQADPYIIEIGTTIKVKATGTKAVEDPDATINYDFKQGDTSKQNGTSTTWTLDATDASTVYTIKLDGYTKVNTTSSTTTAATPLYFKTIADVSIPTYQVTVSANDDAMGTVTGGGEYNENATATLNATPNAGYQFVNWTVGGVEKSTNTTYSFTVTEAVEVVANFKAIPTTTVYFVNAEDWTGTINAYAWTDGTPKVENAGWPGVAAHKEDYQIEGHDVYSYTAEEGKYAKVIFNNNSGKQTNDLAWTAGQYICKNQWYATIAEVEAALAAPIEYESVYFINTNDWAAVNIYTWIPEVGSWPGVAMTEETEKIAGKDVYSYTVEKGTTFGGIKFNEGQDKAETGDLTWQAGKYYAPSTGEWYADAATAEAALAAVVTYDYYIAGTENLTGYNWKENGLGMEKDGELYKATFTELNAGEYEFKITDGQWNTAEDKTHEWGYSNLGAAYEEVSQGTDGEGNPNGNIKFVTEEAKNITVIFDPATGKITFEGLTLYVVPLTYTVTVPAGTEKCYIVGAFAQSNWNTFLEMDKVDSEDKFTITITGAKESDEYKYACQESWDYVEKDKDGNDLAGNRTWKENDEVENWGKPVIVTYQLKGVGGWDQPGIELEQNPDPEKASEYMLTCQAISATDAIKVVRLEDGVIKDYYGNGTVKDGVEVTVNYDGDGNITLAEGKYNFYFDTNEAEKKLWIAAATGCPVTVTVEDEFGTNTYTGVEENEGVWSKEYNVGDEVTLNIASIDPELVFAYWSVDDDKIFTEEYTFTATEDVTVTAVYALPMEVTFDNMTLDTDSWFVEAGPDAEYGVTVTLGIDVEGDHPKGFGLVDGSQIYLGEDQLELVTGYFTDVDHNAPSAEAVIIAVYAEELMAFVCSMSGVAAPAVPVEVLEGAATVNGAGELWITGQWEGDDVYVQVPGFDGVSFDCPEIWFYVGGTDFETASIIARGPATITVEDGDVTVEGTVTSGATSTDYELFVIGTLPVTAPDYTHTPNNTYGTICLPYASASTTGAIFYRVAGKEEGKVYLESVDALEAGVPYIFEATAGTITVTYQGEAVAEAGTANGLVGTFTEITVPNDAYILHNNAFCTNNDATKPNKIKAYRAYLDLSAVTGGAPNQMPGRRYIGMDVQGENEATGLDNITTGAEVVKTIENGQLIIIRGGEKFNAQGQKL